MSLLQPEHLVHIGREAPPRTEVVTRRDIRKYAIATNQRQRRYLDGDVAPPLFHVALFWDVVERSDLTPDGVSIDRFIPKLPLDRAMAGGLEIDYHDDIRADDVLVARRTLVDIYEKEGSSGPLIFYEVIMAVQREDGSPVVTEKTTRLLR